MYNKIIIFLLFISFSFTFYIHTPSTLNQQFSNSCTDQEFNKIVSGVNICSKIDSQHDSFICIVNFLGQNFQKQWDVFIQSSTSPDAIYFWSLNRCVIQLGNYGPYLRTIYIWEVDSPNTHQIQSKRKIMDFNNKQIDTKNNVETSQKSKLVSLKDDCSSYRVLAVQSAISSCDIEGNYNAAACISNKVNSKIGQKWGTLVKTGGDSMASIWIYGNCWVKENNVGLYNRTINVWKAQV